MPVRDVEPSEGFRVLAISSMVSSISKELLHAVQRAVERVGAIPILFESDGRRAAAHDPVLGLGAAACQAQAVIAIGPACGGSCGTPSMFTIEELDAGSVRRKPVGLITIQEGHDDHGFDHLRTVMTAAHALIVPPVLVVSGEDFLWGVDGAPVASADLLRRIGRLVEELTWLTARLGCDATGYEEPVAAHPEALGPTWRPDIGSAVSYIRQNFTDSRLTLDVAARAANMSRYHFSRTFKKHTGKRFIDFVTELRMEEARSLLSRTDLTIAEICRSVGYQDVSHFQRTFKNVFNVPPSRYRNAHAGIRPKSIA